MDMLSFLEKVISSCAWPLTVVLLFFMSRNQISNLLNKLNELIELKCGYLQFRFKDIPDEKSDTDKKDNSKQIIEDSLVFCPKNKKTTSIDRFFDIQIRNTLRRVPNMAIILIWSQIEAVIRKKAVELNLPKDKYPRDKLSDYMNIVFNCTNIKNVSKYTIDDMLDERDDVIEGNRRVSERFARKYYATAKQVINDILSAKPID